MPSLILPRSFSKNICFATFIVRIDEMLNRRDFIKLSSLAALGLMVAGCGENSASGGKADLVVYGKIFTSEDNKIVEAFAVKDGKFIYVGEAAGAENFIELKLSTTPAKGWLCRVAATGTLIICPPLPFNPTCPVTEIHTAKPAATYFEGQKVFSI